MPQSAILPDIPGDVVLDGHVSLQEFKLGISKSIGVVDLPDTADDLAERIADRGDSLTLRTTGRADG